MVPASAQGARRVSSKALCTGSSRRSYDSMVCPSLRNSSAEEIGCAQEAHLLFGLLVNRVQVPDSASRLSTAKEHVICDRHAHLVRLSIFHTPEPFDGEWHQCWQASPRSIMGCAA